MSKFVKGQSGNPNGRPVGIIDKRVVARERVMQELFPEAVEALSVALKKNEPWAIKLIFDFSLPKLRTIDSDEILELLDRLETLEETLIQRPIEAANNG